jgi:hypothetical protein
MRRDGGGKIVVKIGVAPQYRVEPEARSEAA